MRILLPPSETKRAGGTGPPLTDLGFAGTMMGRHRHRRRLAAAVQRTAHGRASTAATAFALPPAVAQHAIQANSMVLTSGTVAALERYRGTVYDALDVATLSATARTCADASVLIFSGLFGVAAATEQVPDYRVPAATVLPRIGGVGSSWRAVLVAELPRLLADDVAIDLRSTDYTAMWRPGAAGAAYSVIPVRMLSRRADGRVAVTSFFSKRGKGLLARALLQRSATGGPVRSAQDVAETWVGAGLGDVHAIGASSVDLLTADQPHPHGHS